MRDGAAGASDLDQDLVGVAGKIGEMEGELGDAGAVATPGKADGEREPPHTLIWRLTHFSVKSRSWPHHDLATGASQPYCEGKPAGSR